MDNGGFTPGKYNSVRLEALTPDLSRVLATVWVNVNNCGNLTTSANLTCSSDPWYIPRLNVAPYVGEVQIMADQVPAPGGTAGGQTHVYPLFTISASAVGTLGGPGPLHPVCSVSVSGSNYQATLPQTVLVRLFEVIGPPNQPQNQQWIQLDWKTVPLDGTSSTFSLPKPLTPQSWNSGQTYYVTALPDVVGQPAETSVVLCPPY